MHNGFWVWHYRDVGVLINHFTLGIRVKSVVFPFTTAKKLFGFWFLRAPCVSGAVCQLKYVNSGFVLPIKIVKKG